MGTVNRVGETSPMGKGELTISAESLKSLRVGTDWQYLLATGLSGPTLRLAFHTVEKQRPCSKVKQPLWEPALPQLTLPHLHSSAKTEFITSQGSRSPPGTLLSC